MKHPVAFAIALCLVAGCAATRKDPPPKPFVGTHWEVKLELPLAGEQPSMRFGDGRVEGFGGCNNFTARYLQDSVGSSFIAVRRVEVGNRQCDAATRAAETNVLTVLQSVSSYTILGDAMTMSGSGGTLKMGALGGDKPADAKAGSASPAGLEATRWVAAGTADAQVRPRLEFAAGGLLAGYTGCNLLNGEWHADGGIVVLSKLSVTKRLCTGVPAEVEKAFLSIVTEGSRAATDNGKLVITSPSGVKLELAAAAAA